MAATPYKMVVPVENLYLHDLPAITVGRVAFTPTDVILPKMKDHIRSTVQTSTYYDAKDKAAVQKTLDSVLTNVYSGAPVSGIVEISTQHTILNAAVEDEKKFIADLKAACPMGDAKNDIVSLVRMAEATLAEKMDAATAETEKARLTAEALVDDALDLLRCFTHVLFGRGTRTYIGLVGSVSSGMRTCFGMNEDGYVSTTQQVGRFFEFDLNQTMLETLRSHCAFDELSAALAKPVGTRTDLEEVVTGSMWRLARGIVGTDPTEQFLNIMIALESMMVVKREAGKSEKVSRRLAALMGTGATDRPQIQAMGRAVYRRRCDHAHEAAREAPVDEVVEIEGYALGAFIQLAKKFSVWSTHRQFADWADGVLPPPPPPRRSAGR